MTTASTTLVLLVRHGVTPTTGEVLPGRAPGLHLSDAGRAQAEAVADRLAELPIAAIHTSPLERCVETSAPLAARSGLQPVSDPGLTECDFGDWTGRQLAELARLPDWQVVQRSPSRFRFPGGESFAELSERMVGTIDRIRHAHPGRVVVCFSHADPIKAVLTHALGAPLDALQRVWIDPASVSVLGHDGDGPVGVIKMNTTTGSLRELRTG